MKHRLRADLLVLSACQTGISESLAGDEFAGLAQAFLYAGARSVLVSLWSVQDTSTADLMTAFYTNLSNGSNKAQALTQAMGTVRAHTQWQLPYFWGAFVLIGDW
jgi:CHAT domain-containing protein